MVTEFDLLTGEGRVVHCSPVENADLFYMLPNSYGTLGYVLKCTIQLNRVRPFVHLNYGRFNNRDDFFAALDKEVHAQQADFIEGVSFSAQQYILLSGEFADALPPGETLFNPLYEPFFLSQRDSLIEEATLTTWDYIWRWDMDAFFATDQHNMFGSILLNPRFRRMAGKYVLRSDRLIQIGKLRNKLRHSGQAKFLFQENGRREALIQDAAIPFDRAVEFDGWLAQTLGIYPLWYCPVKTTRPIGTYPLYRPGSEFVVDFGFYCSMDLSDEMDDFHYNRAIEEKLVTLDGLKCLYSDTFFSEEQFWSLYDKVAYDQVKTNYDPQGIFLDLYHKVVNP
jgi:FAD/FMN-containing dehydrogenase